MSNQQHKPSRWATQRRVRMMGVALLVGLLAIVGGVMTRPIQAEAPIVDARVLEDTADGKVAHFLVFLAEQADLQGATRLRTKAERGAFVVTQLQTTAAASQAAVTATLDQLGVPYRSYWVVNMLAVEGDRAVVDALAANPAVASIKPDRAVQLVEPLQVESPNEAESPAAVEWGVTKIRAPEVWQLGYTGTGIVVANQDTGIQWDHPALQRQYRGWSGSSATHDYNWWDAIRSDIGGGGNPCGLNLQVPCDDNGHGTHTVGTSVGDDGAGNAIGVAPGAKWIGCRNMEAGVGRPSTYTECFQFFLAPTKLDGTTPRPDLAPHVISNSWTCPRGAPPSGEDCDAESLRTVVENVRAAGIVVVAAAGNNGSACGTVMSPPAYHDASTTIGATTSTDTIANFSSRGPGINGLVKPDLVAPGVGVRSALPSSSYGSLSGTSMATPHVAGAIALLWSARPGLVGNVSETETLLFNSAVPLTTGETCGGVSGTTIPNNTFGWGRLDIFNAVNTTPTSLTVGDMAGTSSSRGQLVTGLLLLLAAGLIGLGLARHGRHSTG